MQTSKLIFALSALVWFLPAFANESKTVETPTLLYHTEHRTVFGDSEKSEYEVAIRKDLFIPALEESLSPDGSIKVTSIEISKVWFYWLDLTINLNMDGDDYTLDCELRMDTHTSGKPSLEINSCSHQRWYDFLPFTKSPLVIDSPLLHIEAQGDSKEDGEGFMIVAWQKIYQCQRNRVSLGNCEEYPLQEIRTFKFQVPYRVLR